MYGCPALITCALFSSQYFAADRAVLRSVLPSISLKRLRSVPEEYVAFHAFHAFTVVAVQDGAVFLPHDGSHAESGETHV
jgi:hypothetical protein